MTKNKVCFVVIATANKEDEYQKMSASLKKFHPDIPLVRYSDEEVDLHRDSEFFYRATPIVGKELLEKYEYVVKIDSDTVVTGDLSELWQGQFDVAVVNNSNPREFQSYPYQLWDVHPLAYVNAGLVGMHSKRFVQHWLNLCYSGHYNAYQMREQDLLNILVHYGDYTMKKMDEGDSFYGLASKGYWPEIEIRGEELVLPKGTEENSHPEWPDKDKIIRAIHWAGGKDAKKMDFHTRFQPNVVRKLKELTT